MGGQEGSEMRDSALEAHEDTARASHTDASESRRVPPTHKPLRRDARDGEGVVPATEMLRRTSRLRRAWHRLGVGAFGEGIEYEASCSRRREPQGRCSATAPARGSVFIITDNTYRRKGGHTHGMSCGGASRGRPRSDVREQQARTRPGARMCRAGEASDIRGHHGGRRRMRGPARKSIIRARAAQGSDAKRGCAGSKRPSVQIRGVHVRDLERTRTGTDRPSPDVPVIHP
ncbi:hypothetical protein FB451DRAFT_1184990 [Mycena latifolia]|nr:hypothetical protein FB451DRAFT_1184990 [Mycena latifolia]